MKIRTIVVDDDIQNSEFLINILAKYCQNIEIIGKAYNELEAVNLINTLEPQLLFLDIELGQNTGFDVLRRIRNTKMGVIFVTAYESYAIDAIKYSAFDYLLKPLSIDGLIVAVKNFEEYLNQKSQPSQDRFDNLIAILEKKYIEDSSQKIELPFSNGIEKININKVILFKADGRNSLLITEDDSRGKPVLKKLQELESMLGSGFFKIHKSYIINLVFLDKILRNGGGYCLLKNGLIIPIAKKRIQALKDKMNIP